MASRTPIDLGTATGPLGDELEVTWVGTATCLIRGGGFTVLTDPCFLHQGEVAPLGWGLRSKRLTEPSMRLEDLPPLDAVVLSHHHGDHFDPRSAEQLRKDLPITTTPHAAAKLQHQGFQRPVALRPWDVQELRRGEAVLRVTSLPGQHAPRPVGFLIPPVMGSLLEWELGGRLLARLYVTGDTLLHGGIEEIGRRVQDIDLALVHLGGTRIGGLLLTMDAAQGVEALRLVRPKEAVPIHHGDFTVFKDPVERFHELVATAGLATRVVPVERGGTHRLPLGAGPAQP